MRTIINEEDVFVLNSLPEFTPALRNNFSDPASINSSKNSPGHLIWIFHDNTAESNIDRCGARSEEFIDLVRGRVRRCISKEKSADI